MIATSKVTAQTSAMVNRRLVLRWFQRIGALSRRQLSQITGLRDSTLSYIVRDLIDAGVLRAAGTHDSGTVGPKQQLQAINPDLGHVLGIEIRRQSATVVVRDVAGGLIDLFDLPLHGTLESLPDQLQAGIDQRQAGQRRPETRLLGMAVGMPGVIDADAGVVLNSVAFDARNVPFSQLLARRFDMLPLLDHNANFAALAESREGACADGHDFVLLLINQNEDPTRPTFKAIGAALVIGGRIYRGTHGAAGELDGHLAPRPSFVADDVDLDSLRVADAPLTDKLMELAGLIGRMAASMANLLDPAVVIVGGDLIIANRQFQQTIQTIMPQRLIPVQDRTIPAAFSTLGQQAVARGAALAAIDRALLGEESTTPQRSPVVSMVR